MLTGVHFLLTLNCNFECDHCFLFSRPGAGCTFTIGRIRNLLDELKKTGTIESVCFEGGEPALYYSTMLEGIRLARERGFSAGIVTNAYWAVSDEDAELWLRPLAEQGVSRISISDDELHYGDEPETPPKRAIRAAERLGVSTGSLVTNKPCVEQDEDGGAAISGGVMFRGRAVEKLSEGLPRRPCSVFAECPHEDLRNPGRVHVDALGNVHLCQGISMGNYLETPFSELVARYDPDAHPVSGPLLRGGPLGLAKEYAVEPEDGYIDACHFCYDVRKRLIGRFPQYLAPPQVYGL